MYQARGGVFFRVNARFLRKARFSEILEALFCALTHGGAGRLDIHKFLPGTTAGFKVNVTDVVLHGTQADKEFGGDALVGVVLLYHGEDLPFPAGEFTAAVGVPVDFDLEPGIDVFPAGQHGFNGPQ
jgi:hypothetical protein